MRVQCLGKVFGASCAVLFTKFGEGEASFS